MSRQRFYDLKEFPVFSEISENWPLIREEVLALDAPALDINRVNKSHEEVFEEMIAAGQNGWLKGWNTDGQPNENWLTYPIRFYDQMVFDISKRMPMTSRLVQKLEGIRVCALNKMLPDLFLGTHTHPDHAKRGTLLYHLSLVMDDKENPFNYLNVNGEFVQQVPGKAYIFDGANAHFALNASKKERIILYIEFYAEKARTK